MKKKLNRAASRSVILVLLLLMICTPVMAAAASGGGVSALEATSVSPSISIELLVTSSILEKCAANLPLKVTPVGFVPEEAIEIKLVGSDETVYGSAVADSDGKAIIRASAFPEAGIYTFIATYGAVSGSLPLKVVPYDLGIWDVVILPAPDGVNTVITFGHIPTPKYGSFDGYVTVDDTVIPAGTLTSGRNITVPYKYADLTDESIIIIGRVQYPDLFPSYSFTFTVENDTDPDKDGMSSYWEIKYGMNPTNPSTLNDGILDGDRIFTVKEDSGQWNAGDAVKPSLEVQVQGKYISSFSANINKINSNDAFLNSGIPGYIGNAYAFTVNGTLSSASVSYEVSADLFSAPKLVPAIYRWDETLQAFFELPDQTIAGNSVSAQIDSSATYMVLSKNIHDTELLKYDILAPTDEELSRAKFDLALVLDESGSISATDYGRMKSLTVDLINKLEEEDRIAVFTFATSVVQRSGFVNKNTAATVVKTLLQAAGLTAIYDGINRANAEFINYSSPDATKIMIVLTDGQDNRSSATANAVIQNAVQHNIVIYTIGIGAVDAATLNNIATQTGGTYYSATNFSQLSSIFDRIEVEVDLYRDSDNDGLSDYHEKKIARRRIHRY